MEPDRRVLRRQLLAWYRARKRDLPFRRTRDPYAILVAEFVLQRTRVKAGLPYYERFLASFPTVRNLAAASEMEVLRVWEGLGFYNRARNLHRASKAIVDRHDGEVPSDLAALKALPGIGDYTAGAVGSIAFGLRAPAVDGNVIRVVARVFRIADYVTRGPAKERVKEVAAELVPDEAPGEWNQAVMELGAIVCVPRVPKCPDCPISSECLAFASGVQASLPVRPTKPRVPVVRVAFVVAEDEGHVFLVRKGEGLHAGMYRESGEDAVRRHLRALGLRPVRVERFAPVSHRFSHLRWEGWAYRCRAAGEARAGEWIALDRLSHVPLIPFHRRLLASAVR
ncbi:MAG: A/G-specific adenine glycosylase [Methanobacteriota archaeon]|nr:MAG: A/G-specific adenine glycosylase [Euryarchaeota archaeon]